MAINPDYIVAIDLCEYFVDKSTGQPMSGGFLYFYEDLARNIPKNVFTLTGGPGAYMYVPLPNPIVLSASGNVQDANGNNLPIYYYPFDAEGNIQLYYVVCTNSQGTEQFTRQAWPNTSEANAPGMNANSSFVNKLSNPQFSSLLFDPAIPLTFNYSGAGTFTTQFAPDWFLQVVATGAGQVVISRTSIAGNLAYPFNPPYTLTVTPGANLTSLSVIQQLTYNPNIWSPQNGASTNGWISGSILLANGSSASLSYAPNGGAPSQMILNANNATPNYMQYNNTIQLTPPANPLTSDTGYVNIVIGLPVGAATTFSNVQIVSLQTNIQNVPYDEVPVNQETDGTIDYWLPWLKYKPIPSYLIGWDFAFNPAQFYGYNVPASGAGANTSSYVWDQTIVFQSANNAYTISEGTAGALDITAAANSRLAIIQYLGDEIEVRKILNDWASVNVSAVTDQVGGVVGTVSLWYTTSATLPDMSANNSLVATLDANGKPATFHGTWVEITRPIGGSVTRDARFTVTSSPTTNFNNYSFSGWNLGGTLASVDNAVFFAIVVGFSQLNTGNSISISSVSLVPGMVPTVPAATTFQLVIADCKRLYQKSFAWVYPPQQNFGKNTGEFITPAYIAGASLQAGNQVPFEVEMRRDSPIITTYSPAAASGQPYNETTNQPCTNITIVNNFSRQNFIFTYTADAGCNIGNLIGLHWTADARYGIGGL